MKIDWELVGVSAFVLSSVALAATLVMTACGSYALRGLTGTVGLACGIAALVSCAMLYE